MQTILDKFGYCDLLILHHSNGSILLLLTDEIEKYKLALFVLFCWWRFLNNRMLIVFFSLTIVESSDVDKVEVLYLLL